MYGRPLPYVLEDRTGANTSSDFDEIYDRVYFRVARSPQSKPTTTMIYNMNSRATRHRDTLPFTTSPIVILDFQEDESLGIITYLHTSSKAPELMSKYLRKTSIFGS